jgi:hypothetical protein
MMLFHCLSTQVTAPSSSSSSALHHVPTPPSPPQATKSDKTEKAPKAKPVSSNRIDLSQFPPMPGRSADVISPSRAKKRDEFPEGHSSPKTPTVQANSQGLSFGAAVVSTAASDQERQRKLEERLGIGGIGGKNPSSANKTPSKSTSAKKITTKVVTLVSPNPAHAELSPDEKGIENGAQPRGKPTTPSSSSNKRTFDPFDIPASHFPGNQQFFYRFVVMADNQRFAEAFQEQVCRAIIVETASISRQSNVPSDLGLALDPDVSFGASPVPSSLQYYSHQVQFAEPLSVKVLKLRLLGKFLGLIEFWPQWTLDESTNSASASASAIAREQTPALGIKKSQSIQSVDTEAGGGQLLLTPRAGPLLLQAQDRAHYRSLFRKVLPVVQFLEKAVCEGSLTLTVPWIVEFLSMMEYDKHMNIENPYRDVSGILMGIQRSDLFHLTRGRLTQNRYSSILVFEHASLIMVHLCCLDCWCCMRLVDYGIQLEPTP